MMKKHLFFVFTIVCLGYSCTKEPDIQIDQNELIIGVWEQGGSVDGRIVMYRTQQLPDNSYGISFNSDGTLVERKNQGWCGTPPVSYGDFAGTWQRLKDKTILVNVVFWGGHTSFLMDIYSLTDRKLVFDYLNLENTYFER